MGFLNISGEAEIHTIPKTCGKWISIVREKCGKTQTLQSYGFYKYFGWHRNLYNSQNLGKVNFHSMWKVQENTNISNIWVSWIFRVKQKSTQFPKHGKVAFHSMGKHKHTKVMFLEYCWWSWNWYSSQNMGKVDFHSRGKVRENTNISKLWVSFIFRLSRSIKISKYGKSNSHSKRKIWENTHISKLRVSEIFRKKQNSMQFPKHG